MGPFLPAAAAGLLVYKVVDFLRYLSARDWNGVVTQLVSWVGAILVFLMVEQTNWAHSIAIGNFALDKLGFWSIVFYGMSVGSGASLTKDVIKAVDNHNTAKIPTLLPTTTASTLPEDVETTSGRHARL